MLAFACLSAALGCPPAAAQQAPQTPPALRPRTTNELDAFMEKVLEAPRGQPPDARAVRPRRKSSSSKCSVRAGCRLSAEAGLHVVRPRRPPRPQPGPLRRRHRRRRGAQEVRGANGLAASADGSGAGGKDAKDAQGQGEGGAETPSRRRSDDRPRHPARRPFPTPRFVSEAYFMDFKFEPGNYYLVGRELARGAAGAAHRVLPDAHVQR